MQSLRESSQSRNQKIFRMVRTSVKQGNERSPRRSRSLQSCADWLTLHDPTTGVWHDLPKKDAPAGVKREATERKRLYKSGVTRLLMASELEEPLAEEHRDGQSFRQELTGKGKLHKDRGEGVS